MRLAVAIVMVAGASSCGAGHAIDAVKKMRDHACAGDSAAFFENIDRTEIARSLQQDADKKVDEAAKKLDPMQAAAFREGAEKQIDMSKLVRESFAEWEDDIKHGEASSICKMSILESKEIDRAAEVHVRTPSGRDRWWRMSRFGKRWLLVQIGGPPAS